MRRALLAFVEFFADEPPQAQRARNLHELYRRMDETDREWLYAVAVMLRERAVPPDLRAGIVQRLADEATRPTGAKRAPKRRHA